MRPRARARKVAICPRVTAREGQYRAGSVLQPAVTPEAARLSMFAEWAPEGLSANPADPPGGRLKARTKKLAI